MKFARIVRLRTTKESIKFGNVRIRG